MNNYNQFTISYIEAICKHLKIETDSIGKTIFVPSRITFKDILELKGTLDELWSKADQSIQIIKQKQDSKLQSCLFGLVDDLDLALRTGYLISDRVVLVDYLYERILRKKKPEQINLQRLGVIASGLCGGLQLAKDGRLVIIPHPFGWHSKTKEFIAQVSSEALLDPASMSLLSTLSIANLCHLLPYTISESDEAYNQITNDHLNLLSSTRKTTTNTAYKSILGALLSEKLITQTNFNILTEVPIIQYSSIIRNNENFYLKFIERITTGGLPYSDINVNTLSKSLQNDIIDNDVKMLNKLNSLFGSVTGISSAAITIASISYPLAVSLKALAAILGFSSRLSSLKKFDESEDKVIIAVFKNLYQVTQK